MNIIHYSDLSFEEKKAYIYNCLSNGLEVFYKTRFGFVFLKNGTLYTDFYDEITTLNESNIRFIMFGVAAKFAHVELYKEDVLDKVLCWDVYNKNLDSLIDIINNKYSEYSYKIFISPHKKDYRNDNRATASPS